jgi:hypothetical protein
MNTTPRLRCVVCGERTDNGTSEVVPDPDCRAGAEMIMQLNHVVNDLF